MAKNKKKNNKKAVKRVANTVKKGRATKKTIHKKINNKKANKKIVKKTIKKTTKKIMKKTAKKTTKKITKKPVKIKTPKKKKIKAPVAIKTVLKKAQPKKIMHSRPVQVSISTEVYQPIITKKQTMLKKSQAALAKSSRPLPIDTMLDDPNHALPTKSTTLLGALEFTPYIPKEIEEYMNDMQRQHFRNILDAWKAQLMQDVDLTVVHLKEDAEFYADPVDRAAQEEGFNLELRARDRERKLIKKIEQSLDLLNTGDYGFCEDCGAEIGIRRLEARPTAVKCIDCKTFQEIREKQIGSPE